MIGRQDSPDERNQRMTKKFSQIHLADMEHGLARVLAVYALSPEQISQLTGIQFDTAREGDFDYVLAALLLTHGGRQFALRCYHRGPFPNRTELVGSERSRSPDEDVKEFLEALGIPRAHLLWPKDDLGQQQKDPET